MYIIKCVHKHLTVHQETTSWDDIVQHWTRHFHRSEEKNRIISKSRLQRIYQKQIQIYNRRYVWHHVFEIQDQTIAIFIILSQSVVQNTTSDYCRTLHYCKSYIHWVHWVCVRPKLVLIIFQESFFFSLIWRKSTLHTILTSVRLTIVHLSTPIT